ncbi:MAG: hypothetical protein LR001_02750 [Clostridiales bacterium]|nr:hypothetical protein [Clostridiales bacterium]
MKKFQVRLLIFLLTFLLSIGTMGFSIANTDITSESSIITETVSVEVREYADSRSSKHLLAASRDAESFGFKDKDIRQFVLGEPFSLYFYEDSINYRTFYFPVLIDPNKNHIVSMDMRDDHQNTYYILNGKLFFWHYLG